MYRLHVVQRSAVSADPAIRLIVETPPVSVRTLIKYLSVTKIEAYMYRYSSDFHDSKTRLMVKMCLCTSQIVCHDQSDSLPKMWVSDFWEDFPRGAQKLPEAPVIVSFTISFIISNAFVRSFIHIHHNHSFIHINHSFIDLFIFIHSLVHSLIHSFMHSFVRSFIIIHSFIIIDSFIVIHSLVHSFIHPFMHQFIH